MSECVVRMEMPKEGCHTCDARCVSALYGYICGIERKNVMPFLGKKNRPDWCPIICQLPEGHGRLIDASYVIDVMQDELDNDVPITVDDCFQIGCKIPTIVPAEAESPSPKPTDPVPIRGVEYVPTEVDVQTGTVTYEPRERIEL